jgi:hypothetical protein
MTASEYMIKELNNPGQGLERERGGLAMTKMATIAHHAYYGFFSFPVCKHFTVLHMMMLSHDFWSHDDGSHFLPGKVVRCQD